MKPYDKDFSNKEQNVFHWSGEAYGAGKATIEIVSIKKYMNIRIPFQSGTEEYQRRTKQDTIPSEQLNYFTNQNCDVLLERKEREADEEKNKRIAEKKESEKTKENAE